MKLRLNSLFAICSALGVLSCATDQSKKLDPSKLEAQEATIKAPEIVGRIASVPSDKRFVLIQSYGKWSSESGQILTTRGPENRTANLKVTGEKLGEFAAADLQSGTVEVGDAVYYQHVPKPVTSPAPLEVPLPEGKVDSENVQKNN